MSSRRALLSILYLPLSSCSTPGAAGAGDAAAPDAAAADVAPAPDGGGGFAAVLAIFAGRCVICHDPTKQGLPTYPQLPLTAADAYAALVGHPADEACGGTRVVAGDPQASYLLQKLTHDTPCEGLRMPRSFEGPIAPPLPPDQIATITAWIAAGASP
jgi:hypothetical protein